jgi:hypothetical protein
VGDGQSLSKPNGTRQIGERDGEIVSDLLKLAALIAVVLLVEVASLMVLGWPKDKK